MSFHHSVAATVAGDPVLVDEVDAREIQLRATIPAATLPAPDTSEGRQLRRWLTQLIVTEKVVAAEASRAGVDIAPAPSITDLLPDDQARHELGSIAAAALAEPAARSLFVVVTKDVAVSETELLDYHQRNPMRFAPITVGADGWQVRSPAPELHEIREHLVDHLLAAKRRKVFRNWLDVRRCALVELSPGYEHPGDPRQPDNVHRH